MPVKAAAPFNATMARVDRLIGLHVDLHGKVGRPKQEVSDILRGALVLAVGALDGLVQEASLEMVRPAAKKRKLGDTVNKWAKEDTLRVLSSLASVDPIAGLEELCREHLGSMTFQRSEAIAGALMDIGGADVPWDRAATSLTTATDKWDANRVVVTLDQIVKRRHRIAHAGDRKHGLSASSPIQVSYVSTAVKLIRAVGDAVCAVTDARIKSLKSTGT